MNRFPTTTLLRQHRLAAAVLVALLPAAAMAAPAVEFNPSLLHGNIDVSRFERDGNLPGVYNVDVQVNGRSVGKQEVEVRDADGEERLCLPATLFDLLGLDAKKLQAVQDKAGQADTLPLPTAPTCEDLGRFIPSATVRLDADEQILEASIPQAFLASRSSGWVDPAQWDNGINAFLLNYSVNHTRSQFGGESASRTSGSLDAGLNLGAWRFRHNGYFSQVNGEAPVYSAGTSHAQREIRRWNAQLTLGEASTDGDLFNSVGYLGANLRTDPRMLPETANNYAPVVRGVAQTNARVTIRQAGHVVFETTVAPGPFEIDDLRNTSRGGDLEVEVTEADGRVESFVVPYAAVPGLLRQGQQRSSVTVGQLRNEQTDAPMFAQATVRRGVGSAVTAYGGALVADGYAALLLGAAVNTRLGAFSGDVTFADTRLPGEAAGFGSRMQGQSYRLAYSRSFSAATSFTLAAYRYSTDGYLDFSDAARLQSALAAGESGARLSRQRSRLDLTVNQRLPKGSLYLQGSSIDYWTDNRRSTNFSLGYAGQLGRASFNISARRSMESSLSGGPKTASTSANLSVHVPLGRAPAAPRLSASANGIGRDTGYSANLSGQFGADQQGAYNLSYGQSSQQRDFGASVNYLSPKANLGASWNSSDGGHQLGLSATGSVVVHGGGATFSQRTGDTVGLLHVPGAANAMVGNRQGIRTDKNGYALVPYLSAYRQNEVSVDSKGLSMDVELKAGSVSAVPTAGAVVKMMIPTAVGRSALIEARDSQGKPLPFGADVFDEQGVAVGIVGQGSRLWVRGVNDKGLLRVDTGSGPLDSCTIAYDLAAAGDEPIHMSSCQRGARLAEEAVIDTGVGAPN